jgi:hypothetical protein
MRTRSKPKTFLDASRRDWQFDAFAWLLRNCGGYSKFQDTTLVLPTEEHFPDRGMKGHAGVAALFRRVRDHAGMEDWPCTVEPAFDEPRTPDARQAGIRVFTYKRGALEPVSLVAGFACDLARYLTETFAEAAPGGESMREAAAEITAVFMGFGVFMANASARHGNYRLCEGELTHALALFCLLRQVSNEVMDKHLNPHLRKYVRLAERDLAQHETKFQKLRRTVQMPTEATAGVVSPTQAG